MRLEVVVIAILDLIVAIFLYYMGLHTTAYIIAGIFVLVVISLVLFRKKSTKK